MQKNASRKETANGVRDCEYNFPLLHRIPAQDRYLGNNADGSQTERVGNDCGNWDRQCRIHKKIGKPDEFQSLQEENMHQINAETEFCQHGYDSMPR